MSAINRTETASRSQCGEHEHESEAHHDEGDHAAPDPLGEPFQETLERRVPKPVHQTSNADT